MSAHAIKQNAVAKGVKQHETFAGKTKFIRHGIKSEIEIFRFKDKCGSIVIPDSKR